jgi:hypothetical protein
VVKWYFQNLSEILYDEDQSVPYLALFTYLNES